MPDEMLTRLPANAQARLLAVAGTHLPAVAQDRRPDASLSRGCLPAQPASTLLASLSADDTTLQAQHTVNLAKLRISREQAAAHSVAKAHREEELAIAIASQAVMLRALVDHSVARDAELARFAASHAGAERQPYSGAKNDWEAKKK